MSTKDQLYKQILREAEAEFSKMYKDDLETLKKNLDNLKNLPKEQLFAIYIEGINKFRHEIKQTPLNQDLKKLFNKKAQEARYNSGTFVTLPSVDSGTLTDDSVSTHSGGSISPVTIETIPDPVGDGKDSYIDKTTGETINIEYFGRIRRRSKKPKKRKKRKKRKSKRRKSKKRKKRKSKRRSKRRKKRKNRKRYSRKN